MRAVECSPASPLHRAPPRLKLLGLLIVLIGTVLLPRRPDLTYCVPGLLLVCAWAIARMPLWYGLQRLLLAQLFIVSIGLLSLFNPAGWPWFIGTWLKSNLCVLAMIVLTWTTAFQEILRELRKLHFPSVMLSTLALMYRYLPVLTEESRRMQRARASRTFVRRRGAAWRNISGVGGQLFIRSAERAERIYLAMCARGWK